MKKSSRLFWILQVVGWFSYALTIVFFAYLLEKQVSTIFLKRIIVSVFLGILLTASLRQSIIKFSLRPPFPPLSGGGYLFW